METHCKSIVTEEPFKKKWSEASTIISDEELARAESDVSSDVTDGSSQETELNGKTMVEVVKPLNPAMPGIAIHPDVDSHSQPQDQPVQTSGPRSVFRTPQKLHSEFVQKLQNLHSSKHKRSNPVLGENSDWMLAERSNSRSPPSPALDVTSRSPLMHHVSPSPSARAQTMFNFSPERTESYRAELELESRRVKKRLFEEIALGQELSCSRENLSPSYISGLHSPTHLRDTYIQSPRHMTSLERLSRDERDPEVPYYTTCSTGTSSLGYFSHDREPFRAKRRLDVDQEYISTPKRLKSDFEREMGYRYIEQLDTDISSIRNKLFNPKEVTKPTNCTCAIMERQFLEMAESAYRSVRRNDGSPRGFEQFRRELIQTNEVMKDSMEVLKNIRSFCEHKC